MIDIRKLKELVRLMVANELTELDLRDSEEQVTLRRQGTSEPPLVETLPQRLEAPVAVAAPQVAQQAGSAAATAVAPPPPAEQTNLVTVKSPMVGTFYAAPRPDASPFVSEGSSVAPETVVCIIEAMKIFNEIRAECTGTITQVLVANGDPVEFGQPLFTVKPL